LNCFVGFYPRFYGICSKKVKEDNTSVIGMKGRFIGTLYGKHPTIKHRSKYTYSETTVKTLFTEKMERMDYL